MKTNLWDKRFIELAALVASWSKDPSTKVGAVLVQSKNDIVGFGYNGFPKGVIDDQERYLNRELKYKLVVHAEVNAILMAGEKAKGGRLYVYPSFALPPICNECCKIAIQSGVREIIGDAPNENDPRVARWLESIKISKLMCDEAGVSYRFI